MHRRPQSGTVTGAIDADEESGKSDSGKGGHRNAGVVAGRAFGAGDQPDADAGEQEAGDGQRSRQPLRNHGERGWDGGAENSRDRSSDAHIATGEGAIKNR